MLSVPLIEVVPLIVVVLVSVNVPPTIAFPVTASVLVDVFIVPAPTFRLPAEGDCKRARPTATAKRHSSTLAARDIDGQSGVIHDDRVAVVRLPADARAGRNSAPIPVRVYRDRHGHRWHCREGKKPGQDETPAAGASHPKELNEERGCAARQKFSLRCL